MNLNDIRKLALEAEQEWNIEKALEVKNRVFYTKELIRKSIYDIMTSETAYHDSILPMKQLELLNLENFQREINNIYDKIKSKQHQ